MADGDMLIYEPQGFSLTILRFSETERDGEREKLRRAQGAKPRGRGTMTEVRVQEAEGPVREKLSLSESCL